MATKILLDTDIGSDIDDAVCLAYLLAQPACDLLGITTVSGQADKRAMMASALCRVAGVEIPIFPGAEEPLLVPQKQTRAPQAAVLKEGDYQSTFPKGEAVEFLRQTIHQHPGEIVLLTIGPLTNIALLFKTDPEIPSLLKALVLMCGVFTERLAGWGLLEWNALLDPHATAIVYQTPVPIHRSIGLDVTRQVTMNQAEVQAKFQTALLRPVYDFARVWFEQRPTLTFHDPLAAATIFDEQICRFERGRVSVELTSERLKGLTFWDPEPVEGDAPHEVALGVDPARFFAHYFSVFG
jgi:inosine-uridine nucleoside N-ribohydrolase